MPLRGIVKNGVIWLQDSAHLPDGTAVDVVPRVSPVSSLRELPAFGLWRNRAGGAAPGSQPPRAPRGSPGAGASSGPPTTATEEPRG